MTTLELIEKHGIGNNCLSDAYELGRKNAIDEALQIFHNVYTQNLYCMEDECESKGMDCDGCLYITFQKHLKLLKGGAENE